MRIAVKISATRLRDSVRRSTHRRLIVVGLVIVAIVIAGGITYLLIPPLTITVLGVVGIQSAYQVSFDSLSQFPYSVRVDSAGRYSVDLPNQQSYQVFLNVESSSGYGIAALLRCGTLDLYQTTKLGSTYSYNIAIGQCS
jgi:hypothetical protein